MQYYSIAIAIVAGICLSFAVLHLFIGLRKTEKRLLNLTFSAFALGYGVTLINGIFFHQTSSVAEHVAIVRWDGLFVVLAFVSLTWYVALYTGVKPRVFLWLLTVAFILPGIANLIRPNLIYSEILGLGFIELPWGEQLSYIEATDSVWSIIFTVAQLATLGFIFVAGLLQYRRGERLQATMLILGLLLFSVAIGYEIAGESGLVQYLPVAEAGFLGLVIMMSLQMSNTVIKTEEELEQHRHHLQALVEARTAELAQTNTQLIEEIRERQQAEEALRRSFRTTRALLNTPPDSALLINPDGKILDINQVGAARFKLTTEQAIGANAFDLIDPELSRSRRAKIAAVVAKKQPARWQDIRDGRTLDNTLYPIVGDDNQVDGIAIFSADITEQQWTEQALNNKLEQLSILHEIAVLLAHVTDLQTTLQTVSETLLHLFDACYIHIITPFTADPGQLIMVGFEQGVGTINATVLDISLDSLPIAADVIQNHHSRILSKVQSQQIDPVVDAFAKGRNLQSIMLVPLLARGSATGLLTIATDNAARAFTSAEVEVAETIAADIAAAVENARLMERAKSVAAEEERSRLARDLHDAVTQTIYSASLIVDALPRVWERNPDDGLRNLTKLRHLIRGALAEMRTLLFELRPASLEHANLGTMLQQLADILTGRTRIPVEITLEGQSPVPAPVKIAVYRIAQETLNNIAKHARASRVFITLQRVPEQVTLSIRDNGLGFDPAHVAAESMGLRIMRERADEIDAVLTVQSNPKQGTQINVIWSESGNGNDKNGGLK